MDGKGRYTDNLFIERKKAVGPVDLVESQKPSLLAEPGVVLAAGFCQVGGPTNQLQHHSGLKFRDKSAPDYPALWISKLYLAYCPRFGCARTVLISWA
jgi:hypothetical protein